MADTKQAEATESPPNANQVQQRAMLAFLLPFVVYMIIQVFEPAPVSITSQDEVELVNADTSTADSSEQDTPQTDAEDGAGLFGIEIPGRLYPVVYTVKILVTLGIVIYFFPIYLQWPLRISSLAIVVGAIGGFLWLGCCWLNPTGTLANWLGEEHWLYEYIAAGDRPAYNPLAPESLGTTAYGYLFLAVRFFGLVLLVPVIEEAFLRAFLMRFAMHNNWASIPFGEVNRMAVAIGITMPVLYHPEHFAALVWFSLVTWLMVRTKNYWDCVAAHAITNLILGITVVSTGWWELW